MIGAFYQRFVSSPILNLVRCGSRISRGWQGDQVWPIADDGFLSWIEANLDACGG